MAVDLEIDGTQPSSTPRRQRAGRERERPGELPAGGEGLRWRLGWTAAASGCAWPPEASPAVSCSGGAARRLSGSEWSTELLFGWLLGEGEWCGEGVVSGGGFGVLL